MNRKAVIYARVSSTTDRQSTSRQVEDLTSYAVNNDYEIVKVFEEKASGAKDDRPVLAECVKYCLDGIAPELRKAHQENDKAVMEAYGFNWRTMTESDCVAELFKMYKILSK